MALAQADLRLLGWPLVAEVVGAICVLAIGCVIGLSTRHLVLGSEILNRTATNLLDLLIALVGGLAGGFAFLSKCRGFFHFFVGQGFSPPEALLSAPLHPHSSMSELVLLSAGWVFLGRSGPSQFLTD